MHLDYIPKTIKPKSVDDLIAVSTGTDIKSIQADLRDSTSLVRRGRNENQHFQKESCDLWSH